MDHAQLVHSQWTHAAIQGLDLFIKRVATHDNIADLPSREELALLEEMAAIEACPALPPPHLVCRLHFVLCIRWNPGY